MEATFWTEDYIRYYGSVIIASSTHSSSYLEYVTLKLLKLN